MKKGYSLIEFLVGMILSFLILSLCLDSLNYFENSNNQYFSQDLISSTQLLHIFNLSKDIIVDESEIVFKYLNQPRSLYFVNDKIILKPGTVIYFVNVDKCLFFSEDDEIFVTIFRKNQTNTYLIGYL